LISVLRRPTKHTKYTVYVYISLTLLYKITFS